MTDATFQKCLMKDGDFKRFSHQVWNKEAHQTLVEGIKDGHPESSKSVFLNKHTQACLKEENYINELK